MKILNLHGYGSNPHNGFFHALVKYRVSDILLPVIRYDEEAPSAIFTRLVQLCREEEPDAITGSSMGGYFAALLSSTMGLRAVMVNPCMFPAITLPRIGMRDGGFLRQYLQLTGHLAALENAYAIIGGQDDVIDYHDFTQFLLPPGHCIIVPEGGHASSTLPLGELLETYGETFFGA